MSKRTVITTIAAFGAALFATSLLGSAPASATTASPPPSPGPCTTVYFPVSFGEGVEVFCDQAPNTYQAIAQCSDGVDFWQVPGTLAVANAGPSVAECHGLLLASAQVISYFIAQ